MHRHLHLPSAIPHPAADVAVLEPLVLRLDQELPRAEGGRCRAGAGQRCPVADAAAVAPAPLRRGGSSPCPASDMEAAHGEVGGVPKICWPYQINPHLAAPPSSSSNGLGRSNTPASVLQLLNQHRRNAKGLAMLFILETAAHKVSPLSVIAPPRLTILLPLRYAKFHSFLKILLLFRLIPCLHSFT